MLSEAQPGVSSQPLAQPDKARQLPLLDIADELLEAELMRKAIPPIGQRFDGFDVAAAYTVQSILLNQRRGLGAKLIGRKVGLTSAAMQAQLGVSEPDFGYLLDEMQIPSGGVVRLRDLIAPRIEPEIAFELGRELRGPGVTREDVLGATAAVAPALEIIDSRIADWKITLPDTVADNASSARFVVGERRSLDGLDLAAVSAQLLGDGKVVGSGTGAAVLGHPADAVARVANMLADFGESIPAGFVVIPGAMCASVALASAGSFEGRFEGLGNVTLIVEP